jgi:hypothetical protein
MASDLLKRAAQAVARDENQEGRECTPDQIMAKAQETLTLIRTLFGACNLQVIGTDEQLVQWLNLGKTFGVLDFRRKA